MDRNKYDLCIYSKHVFIFPDGGPALKAQGLLAALFVACSLALKSFQWSRKSRDDLDIYDTPLLKPLFDPLDIPFRVSSLLSGVSDVDKKLLDCT